MCVLKKVQNEKRSVIGVTKMKPGHNKSEHFPRVPKISHVRTLIVDPRFFGENLSYNEKKIHPAKKETIKITTSPDK